MVYRIHESQSGPSYDAVELFRMALKVFDVNLVPKQTGNELGRRISRWCSSRNCQQPESQFSGDRLSARSLIAATTSHNEGPAWLAPCGGGLKPVISEGGTTEEKKRKKKITYTELEAGIQDRDNVGIQRTQAEALAVRRLAHSTDLSAVRIPRASG